MQPRTWTIGWLVDDSGLFSSGFGALLRRFSYAELEPRDCRLVAQRTAWSAGCARAWDHLADERSAAVEAGPDAEAWSPREATLLTAADELHRQRFLSDATWDALDLTPAQRVELCFLVGQVDLIAMALNSFDRDTGGRAAAVRTPLRTGRDRDKPGWLLPQNPRLPDPGLGDIGLRTWLFSKGMGLANGAGAVHGVEMFSRSQTLFWSVVPFLLRLAPLRIGREAGELITLRATWNVGSEYHWGHHGRAARLIGLSEDEIAHVPDGPAWPGYSKEYRAMLEAVDDLHEERRISDGAWTALTATYTTTQIAELTFLTGTYEMLCMALNSFGVRFEQGAWQGGLAKPLWDLGYRRGARRARRRALA